MNYETLLSVLNGQSSDGNQERKDSLLLVKIQGESVDKDIQQHNLQIRIEPYTDKSQSDSKLVEPAIRESKSGKITLTDDVQNRDVKVQSNGDKTKPVMLVNKPENVAERKELKQITRDKDRFKLMDKRHRNPKTAMQQNNLKIVASVSAHKQINIEATARRQHTRIPTETRRANLTNNKGITKPVSKVKPVILGMKQYPSLREKYHVPHRSHKVVPRALRPQEYATLMQLLNDVDELFKKHNLTYFMIYGTLLGSYMFHDIIPWDDDCDVVANNDSKVQILQMFHDNSSYAQEYGIRAYSPQQYLIKLFHIDSPAAGKYKKFPWNFPFIDIAFYKHSHDKVNILDKFNPVTLPNDYIFPLHPRPFGAMWLPAPHNTRKV